MEYKNKKIIGMYITGIIMYLLWPAFIAIVWAAVKIALDAYEKKFPGEM